MKKAFEMMFAALLSMNLHLALEGAKRLPIMAIEWLASGKDSRTSTYFFKLLVVSIFGVTAGYIATAVCVTVLEEFILSIIGI